MEIKELAFKLYRVFNAIPFNNRIKGTVEVKNKGSLLLNCKIKSTGENNKVVFDRGGVFRNCSFSLFGSNNVITFGEYCHATNGEFYIEDSYNSIETGEKTNYAGKIHIACTEGTKILVGENCLFSSEIVVRSGDSHSILDDNGNRINKAKNVIIGNHVWVGFRALITKGVVIPDDSVIGTGAIVTKQFSKKNTVLAGVPAKIVKENVNWEHKRR